MLTAGQLDTLIVIEERLGEQETTLGTYQYVWDEFATVWAEVRDVLPSKAETNDEGSIAARRGSRVRMRYLPGLTSDMRILIDEVAYRIVSGPAEIGERREGMEVMIERYTTEGQEP